MGFDEGARSFRLAENGGSGDSGGGGFMSENKRGEEIERKGKPEKPFEISKAEGLSSWSQQPHPHIKPFVPGGLSSDLRHFSPPY